MSGRCRSCGRSSRSSRPTRGYRRGYRHGRRHPRSVFSQLGFWGWVCLVLAVVWVLADMGVIGS